MSAGSDISTPSSTRSSRASGGVGAGVDVHTLASRARIALANSSTKPREDAVGPFTAHVHAAEGIKMAARGGMLIITATLVRAADGAVARATSAFADASPDVEINARFPFPRLPHGGYTLVLDVWRRAGVTRRELELNEEDLGVKDSVSERVGRDICSPLVTAHRPCLRQFRTSSWAWFPQQ